MKQVEWQSRVSITAAQPSRPRALVENSFVREVMKGWLISSSPDARDGYSTPVVAGRLAGALRRIGRDDVAGEIVNTMKTASFDVREPEPGVRAVLGHWMFGYIHPYPDGNGRIARFLMNAMLASGGYPWTVVRASRTASHTWPHWIAPALIKISTFRVVPRRADSMVA